MYFPLALTGLTLAAAVEAASIQRRDCAISYGGPSSDAKEAVMELVKESSFGSDGETCPDGFGWYDTGADNECYICEDAFISIVNSAADFAGVCFTVEEFEETLEGYDGQRCSLPVNLHDTLGIVYGNVVDFTIDDPDSCWYC